MKTRLSWPCALAAVVVTAAFLLLPHMVYAQQASLIAQLPQGFRDDPDVKQLVQLVELWNNKELKLPAKGVLVQRLTLRLDEVVKGKLYSYQTNDWRQDMLGQASNNLPDQLVPASRISNAAALVLVSLFIKNITDFKAQVTATKTQTRAELELPLFLILGTAQSGKPSEIDAELMIRSVFAWWTTVWPFCDKATPGKTT